MKNMGIRGFIGTRYSGWRAERSELKKIKHQAKLRGKLKRRSDKWAKRVQRAKTKGFQRGRYGLFGTPEKTKYIPPTRKKWKPYKKRSGTWKKKTIWVKSK